MAGQIKVDSINADSNLALKIANTAVAFIDATGLRPTSGNVNLDATATSKLYLPSANTVAIQTAGVTGLSISSSQVVTLANALPVTSGGTGVTTSTGTGAVVLGTSPTITTPTISSLSSASATALTLQSAGTTAITVDTSQNVGVGTTSPSTYGKLVSFAGDIAAVKAHGSGSYPTLVLQNATAGTTFSGRVLWKDGNGNAGWNVGQNVAVGSGYLEFNDGATNRMCIDSSGHVMIGSTSVPAFGAGPPLFVKADGNGISVGYGTSSTQYRIFYFNAGDATMYVHNGSNYASLSAAGAWTNASDVRLKKNIVDIKYGLADVVKMQPRSYQMNDVAGDFVGFVAQELQTVIPEVVSGDPEKQLGVDYGSLVAVAFKAIQELKAINDTQAETITALTARIVALETI